MSWREEPSMQSVGDERTQEVSQLFADDIAPVAGLNEKLQKMTEFRCVKGGS